MDRTGAPHAKVGERLGNRYRLVRLISTDALVDVFEAQDDRLQRKVAVKVQHPDTDTARQPIALENPDLARVLDGGEHRACPYVVMELVDGPTQVVERPTDGTSVMPVALAPGPTAAPFGEPDAPATSAPWPRRVLLGVVAALALIGLALAVAAEDGDVQVPTVSTVPVTAETTTTVAPTTTSAPAPPPAPAEGRGEEDGKGKGKGQGEDGDDD